MTKSEKLARTAENQANVYDALAVPQLSELLRENAAHLRALQEAVEEAPHDEDCGIFSCAQCGFDEDENGEHDRHHAFQYGQCNCFKAEFMRDTDNRPQPSKHTRELLQQVKKHLRRDPTD